MSSCPVCLSRCEFHPSSTSPESKFVECVRCGTFKIDRDLAEDLPGILGAEMTRDRANISAWIWHEVNPGSRDVLIDLELLQSKRGLRAPGFLGRTELLMLDLGGRCEHAGQKMVLDLNELLAPTWSLNERELLESLDYLRSEDRLGHVSSINEKNGRRIMELKIEPKGWAYLEEIQSRQPDSEQCFVAMRISPNLDSAFDDGIAPAILAAGYRPYRVDREEHANRIDDEIVAQIRRSRFMVADFSEQRQSVYFEAGFALGLGLEVIWCCRKDEVSDLHFDVRQYNCIDWKSEAELKERLKRRIVALLGEGPNT